MQNFTKPNSNMFAQIMVMGISDFFSKVGGKSVELIFFIVEHYLALLGQSLKP